MEWGPRSQRSVFGRWYLCRWHRLLCASVMGKSRERMLRPHCVTLLRLRGLPAVRMWMELERSFSQGQHLESWIWQ